MIKVVTLVLTYYLSGEQSDGLSEHRPAPRARGPPISVLSGSGGSGDGLFGGCDNFTGDSTSLSDNATDYIPTFMEYESHVSELIVWTGISASANIVLIALAFWVRFANLYLHWGALATWLLLFLQGKVILM